MCLKKRHQPRRPDTGSHRQERQCHQQHPAVSKAGHGTRHQREADQNEREGVIGIVGVDDGGHGPAGNDDQGTPHPPGAQLNHLSSRYASWGFDPLAVKEFITRDVASAHPQSPTGRGG